MIANGHQVQLDPTTRALKEKHERIAYYSEASCLRMKQI